MPLRERLVAEASEHVLLFDWADVARQTAGVYAECAARRSDRFSGPHRRDDRVGAHDGAGGHACARQHHAVRAHAGAVTDR